MAGALRALLLLAAFGLSACLGPKGVSVPSWTWSRGSGDHHGVRIGALERLRESVWGERLVRDRLKLSLARGDRQVEVACESTFEADARPPLSVACLAGTETATQTPFLLVATASVGRGFHGWILTRRSSFRLERIGAPPTWFIRSSSTSEVLASVPAGGDRQPLRFSPDLPEAQVALLTPIVLTIRQLADPDQLVPAQLDPEVLPAWTSTSAPSESRRSQVARLEAMGEAGLAHVVSRFGRELRPDPLAAERWAWSRYDAPDHFGLSLGIGGQVLMPAGSTEIIVPRASAGGLLVTMGLDLGRRYELATVVALGARSLNERDLQARLGSGRIVTLEDYTSDAGGGTKLSGISAVQVHLALRYALTDWRVRPYLSLGAGFRYEPVEYQACGAAPCSGPPNFTIKSPISAWDLIPGLGLRYALLNSPWLGVELRTELQGHFTFWGRPALRFEGEVTPDAQVAYQRFRALEFGDPALDLAWVLALEGRVRIF